MCPGWSYAARPEAGRGPSQKRHQSSSTKSQQVPQLSLQHPAGQPPAGFALPAPSATLPKTRGFAPEVAKRVSSSTHHWPDERCFRGDHYDKVRRIFDTWQTAATPGIFAATRPAFKMATDLTPSSASCVRSRRFRGSTSANVPRAAAHGPRRGSISIARPSARFPSGSSTSTTRSTRFHGGGPLRLFQCALQQYTADRRGGNRGSCSIAAALRPAKRPRRRGRESLSAPAAAREPRELASHRNPAAPLEEVVSEVIDHARSLESMRLDELMTGFRGSLLDALGAGHTRLPAHRSPWLDGLFSTTSHKAVFQPLCPSLRGLRSRGDAHGRCALTGA